MDEMVLAIIARLLLLLLHDEMVEMVETEVIDETEVMDETEVVFVKIEVAEGTVKLEIFDFLL